MKIEKVTKKVGEKTFENYYVVIGNKKIAIKPVIFQEKTGKWNYSNKEALDLLYLSDTSNERVK